MTLASGASAAAVGAAARGPLAILCGGGDFPVAVARAAAAQGRDPFLVGVVGAADARIEAFAHLWVHVGEVGRLFAALKARGVTQIAIVGAMTRPEFADLRLDWRALRRLAGLAALFRGGDNQLLVGISKFFEAEGVAVVGVHEVAPGLVAAPGLLGARRPSAQAASDARRGGALLDALSPFDAGQAVVVANGRVLAIEAAEGTDAMLARVAELRARRRLRLRGRVGVLVKAPEARPGSAARHAGGRPRNDRRRQSRRTRRRRARRRARADRRSRRFRPRGRRGRPVRARAGGVSAAARPLRVFLVVGEESGDQLGFKLMRALREQTGGAIAFAGVGGAAMEAEGLESLFPLADIAVMGILPVIPKLPKMLARIARDRARDRRRAARRARHHRQPGFHPPGRAAGAQGAARPADRRLCQPVGLGLAAGPGARDARLCRPAARAAALRAGRP